MNVRCVIVVSLIVVAATGCADKKADRIEFVQPGLITDKLAVSLRAIVVNRDGRELLEIPLAYSVKPAGIADVSQNGYVTCIRSGEAAVEILAGGAVGEVPIKCEIVSRIVLPAEWEHVLGRQPPPFDARPVNADGDVINRPVTLSSSNERVVRIVDGRPEGLEVGTATIIASLEGVVAQRSVRVSRLILSEPLSVGDGERRLLTLQQGSYEVEIKVAEIGGGHHGVTMTWVGARCANQPERDSHKVECIVDSTATLSIENPPNPGYGEAVDGYLNVLQVP